MIEALYHHREGLEKALAHDIDNEWRDLLWKVAQGSAQVLSTDTSCIVTQLTRKNELVFWLATGELEEVLELSRDAQAKAKALGVTKAHFIGRRGWGRAQGIKEDGWTPTVTHFTKEI